MIILGLIGGAPRSLSQQIAGVAIERLIWMLRVTIQWLEVIQPGAALVAPQFELIFESLDAG